MPEFVCKFTNAHQILSIKKFDDKKWKGNEGYSINNLQRVSKKMADSKLCEILREQCQNLRPTVPILYIPVWGFWDDFGGILTLNDFDRSARPARPSCAAVAEATVA